MNSTLRSSTRDGKRYATFVATGSGWLVLLLGLLTIYFSARMLVADINTYQAASFVNDWVSRGKLPDKKSWQIAQQAAERSLRIFPVKSGALYEDFGIISEWQHYALAMGNPGADASRRSAIDAYRSAVEFRPYWPYTWARLAVTKMKLLEFDDEFDRALRNSVAYGPWRSDVNILIAEVGLTSWVELSSDQKRLVCGTINRLKVQMPKRTEKFIEQSEAIKMSDYHLFCP